MHKLAVATTDKRQVVDITEQIAAVLEQKSGVASIFTTHTTCGLTAADLDPGGTDQDYLEAFDKMIPRLKFRHPHDPTHMPDHILASLIGPSISLPVQNGQLQLGMWQRLVLFEFDGPRERRVLVSIV